MKTQRFWIVHHINGHVHPVGFSFWRSVAIEKFRAHQGQTHGDTSTWRQLRARGFRVSPVNLVPAT